MRVRTYGEADDTGSTGATVILLHGGPGAPGYMAPIGRELADAFHVLEPFQRRSGGEPLTVARHVADLDELIDTRCDGSQPALVGSSWGAMLALAYASEHPAKVGHIVLIGCGTFDQRARDELSANLDRRVNWALRRRLFALETEIDDPDERLRVTGELLQPVYSYALIHDEAELETCDARGYEESFGDLLRLSDGGTYPAAFHAIKSPVLMLHGDVDPHPGRTIRSGLAPHIPQIEYHEWKNCGHYPWLEVEVHEAFYALLRARLAQPPV